MALHVLGYYTTLCQLIIRNGPQICVTAVEESRVYARELQSGIRELRTLQAQRWAGSEQESGWFSTQFTLQCLNECGDRLCNQSSPSSMKKSYHVALRIVRYEHLAISGADGEGESVHIGYQAVGLNRSMCGFTDEHDVVAVHLAQAGTIIHA